MEKEELVSAIAKGLRIEHGRAERVVDEVIAEIVSPYILRKPGAEVALLDNGCRNNCKEAIALQETIAGRR